MRLVKIHGRGSWAIIQAQGQAKFEGRRGQVRADWGACGALGWCKQEHGSGATPVWAHTEWFNSSPSLHLKPACLPACTAALPVPQVDLKDKWRNLVKHDRIEAHHLEEIEVGGPPAPARWLAGASRGQ